MREQLVGKAAEECDLQRFFLDQASSGGAVVSVGRPPIARSTVRAAFCVSTSIGTDARTKAAGDLARLVGPFWPRVRIRSLELSRYYVIEREKEVVPALAQAS
jgi:hypothetical protein